MADYIDALAGHHGGADLDAKGRAGLVHDLMRAHEVEILQPLLDYLGGRNELRVLGPREAARRAPTVAIQTERKGEEIARDLAAHGIMAGGGDFYAVRALTAQGADPAHGVLRLSFVHYTTEAEVAQLIGALDRVL
jgi:selenocysteine lyase/cysteine desulfurase